MDSSGLLHRLFYSVALGASWGLGFLGLIAAVALKLGWIPAWMTLYASPVAAWNSRGRCVCSSWQQTVSGVPSPAFPSPLGPMLCVPVQP